MSKLNANTYLMKALSALTIVLTGFGGFASQAAQAIEQSCDIDNSMTLIGCDFTDLDLSGKSLANHVIVNSNFSGTNLQSADFQGVNLTSNTFSTSTTLAYANLSQANLSGVDLSGVNLTGATLNNSNFSGANLTGVNLTNANLTDANFSSANLTNAVLSGTNISNTDFSKATFVGLAGKNLNNTPMLLPDNWKMLNGYLVGPRANLANANLSSQNFGLMDVSGADFTNANLSYVNFEGTKLVGAKLNNANLYWSNLTSADFTGADLTGANLTAAAVIATNFTEATLVSIQRECYDINRCREFFYGWNRGNEVRYRVGFGEATLTGVRSRNFPAQVRWYDWDANWWQCQYYGRVEYCARYNSISLPSGWVNRNGVLLGKGVDLSGQSYNGWDFSNLDLSNVSFANTQLTGASFTGSTLTNVDFSGKDLRNVNFGSANLTGANFSRANLEGVNFNNSTLTGANFDGTNLSSVSFNNVTSGQITGEVSGLPSGWKLVNGYLVGRTARLYGANLSGSDLSEMDLSSAYLYLANLSSTNLSGTNLYGADISGANFAGADLSGVRSGGIDGQPSSLPTSWHFIRGYLVGPKANLLGANLSGLGMNGWNLSGINFTNALLNSSSLVQASLIGATLVNTNLTWANLGEADFTNANLSQSDLSRAFISNTNFTQANLSEISRTCYDYYGCYIQQERFHFTFAILTGSKASNLNIYSPWSGYSVSMPSGWAYRNSTFFGPTADLSGLNLRQVDLSNLNLSSANLSGVDLSSANLSGTDLSNAVLTGVKSRAVLGTPSLPAGWVLAKGVFIGAGVQAVNVNLSGLNLEGLNLAGIDLSNSNLSGANLRNADLSGANLRNANLSGADLSGANLNLTDLAGVVFGDVIAQDVIGSPINVPNGWALQDGKFIGTIFLNPVTITGKLELEQQLTAHVSSSPSSVDYVFTWYRDGVAIVDSNSLTYQISIADLGTKLSVRVSASKLNFLSASVSSGEVYVSNALPELQDLSIQGAAVKDGQVTINSVGKVAFSTVTYQVSKDGGRSWGNLAGPNYNIQFNDLGGNLKFRIIQMALGYLTQTTTLDPIAVDGAYILPGFALGSIDGANSGFEVQGNSLIGSTLKATKSVWPTGTKVTGFWWSTNGSSVGAKLSYKSTVSDIGAQLMYVEVGVSPEGAVRYRLSSPITVTPNQFENSSQPTLVGSSALGSKLKFKIGPSWSSRAKYTYQWLSDGEALQGAVGTSYTLTVDDIGSAISIRVCASKLGFANKCEDSLTTDVITYADIKTFSKPTVKFASIKLGRQLTVETGRWQAGVSFQYEWLRDGNVFPNVSRNTYLLTADDAGHAISVRVTGSKPGYVDLSETSNSKVYK